MEIAISYIAKRALYLGIIICVYGIITYLVITDYWTYTWFKVIILTIGGIPVLMAVWQFISKDCRNIKRSD